MQRAEIWWAELLAPGGSAPGYKRPVLIIQSDAFNQSHIKTVIAAVLTTNLKLAKAPGNILLTSKDTGLPKDSVVNVSQLITIDKTFLTERVRRINASVMEQIDEGLRLVLSLD